MSTLTIEDPVGEDLQKILSHAKPLTWRRKISLVVLLLDEVASSAPGVHADEARRYRTALSLFRRGAGEEP